MPIDSQFEEFLNAEAIAHHLSKAEREAFVLALNGLDAIAIAAQLDIRPEAVRQRLSQVYQKFEIQGKGPIKLAKLQQLVQSRYQDYQAIAPDADSCINFACIPPRQDWGEAPDLSVFYGRAAELQTLTEWILEEKCRLIALLGMGGIGKTALSVKLAKQLEPEFDFIIWRSLRNSPPIEEFLTDLLAFFCDPNAADRSSDVAETISQIIDYFRRFRCLLILDDLEAILQPGDRYGRYQSGYEPYGDLLRRIGEIPHHSCAIALAQEKPREISLLASPSQPVRLLKLAGLERSEAEKLLQEKQLTGSQSNWHQLIHDYRGNPLALRMVATTIQEVFNRNVDEYIECQTLLLSDLFIEILEQQFNRLSPIQKEILLCLAKDSNPHSIQTLQEALGTEMSTSDLIEHLEALSGRSLIETFKHQHTHETLFTLQPVINKYVKKYARLP